MKLLSLLLIGIGLASLNPTNASSRNISAANGGPGGWGGLGANSTEGNAGSGGGGGSGGQAGSLWMWNRLSSTSRAPESQAPASEAPTTGPPDSNGMNEYDQAVPNSEAPDTDVPTSGAPDSEAPDTEAPTTSGPSMPPTTTRSRTTTKRSSTAKTQILQTACKWCGLWDGKYPAISGHFPLKDDNNVDPDEQKLSAQASILIGRQSTEELDSKDNVTEPTLDLSEQLPTLQTITEPSF